MTGHITILALRSPKKEDHRLTSMVVHTFNPSIRVAEAGGSLCDPGQQGLHRETLSQRGKAKTSQTNNNDLFYIPVLFSTWNTTQCLAWWIKPQFLIESFISAPLPKVLAWLAHEHSNLILAVMEAKGRTLQTVHRASPKSNRRACSHKVWDVTHRRLSQ